SWQARIVSSEAALESERGKLLADVARREEEADALRHQVEGLREKWTESRRQELESLKHTRARCAALRRHYGRLWRECQKRKAALAREQRGLATRLLAFERWRQELLPRAENAPIAD